jgi:periplasmic protein TonB
MTIEVYSPREIALAAGVPEREVVAALGRGRHRYVLHSEAVRIGRMLAARRECAIAPPGPNPLFWMFSESQAGSRTNTVPLAVSSTLHIGLMAVVVFVATFNLVPRAATFTPENRPAEPMHLVFVATPGPGGGGGGGGLRQKAPAPKAMREGRHAISSPIPERREPKPIVAVPAPPEPKPEPLKAEPLPVVVAPVVTAPADNRSRPGVLDQTPVDNDRRGPGAGGGAGTGTGTGVGAGEGSGVGEGSGGGTGGGPFRPGSGIDPPRLLKEVRADYTEDARRRGLVGEVVLEIVVRRDGLVGDVRILQGLGGGLNDRAVEAVRQWRFSPAQRRGTPVDVIVEVAVEFKLR